MARGLEGWVFFDRGLIDAAAGLQQLTGEALSASLRHTHRYHKRVFLAPLWPEILPNRFRTASQSGLRNRRIQAAAGYAYPSLGYEVVIILPKVSLKERADFVLGDIKVKLRNTAPCVIYKPVGREYPST